MYAEQNKAIVRRIVEEVNNKGNVGVADELLAPGYVGRGPGSREVHGPDGYKQSAVMYRATFPDLHMSIEDMVAEGDKVAWRYTLRATFTGPMGGIAPTGKKVTQTGLALWRFENGKVAEAWGYSDRLDMYKQMGISPPAV
jgi:predicted ester cyclase